MVTDDGNNNQGNNNRPGRVESEEDKAKRLLREIELRRKSIQLEKEELSLGEKRLAQINQEIEAEQNRLALQAQNNETLQELLPLLNKASKEQTLYGQANQDTVDQISALESQLDDTTKSQLQHLETLGQQKAETEAASVAVKSLSSAYGSLVDVMGEMAGVNLSSFKSLKAMNTEAYATAHSLDDMNKQLAVQTGYTSHLQKELQGYIRNSSQTGLLAAEQASLMGALSNEFRDFNALTTDARFETFDLGRDFMVQGVAAESYAATMDKLNRGLGLTGPAALKAARSFETLAVQTGRPLTAVLEEFAALEPQLARFGDKAVSVFHDISKQARELALSTQEVFRIGEMFDTFESAADHAGRLNAQFGTQLNSVALMATDHGERFRMLRGEFDRTGLSVDQFSKRQLQMLASIMETDEDTAKRMFGDPMELRKIQKEMAGTEQRQKDFTTASKKMQIAMEKFFISVEPILTKVINFFGEMALAADNFFSSSMGQGISAVVLLTAKLGALLIPLKLTWKALKALGRYSVIVGESMAAVGSWFARAASWAAPAVKWLGRIGKVASFIAGPLMLAWDAGRALGLFGEKDAALAKKQMAAGITGAAGSAAVGAGFMGVGAVPAAFFGYGAGRLVPEMVNDQKPGVDGRPVKMRAGDLTIKDAADRTVAIGTFDNNRTGRGAGSGGRNQIEAIHVKELTLPITLDMGGQKLEFVEKAMDIILNPLTVRQ